MPTWNAALWNPSQDDGPWINGVPYFRAGVTGYFFFRLLAANNVLELFGLVQPVAYIAPATGDWFGWLPAGYLPVVDRADLCFAFDGVYCRMARIQLRSDGALFAVAPSVNWIVDVRFDVFLPLG